MPARTAKHKLSKNAVSAAGPGAEGLDGLFRPRSIAVIGASRKPMTIGRELLNNLLHFGFEGPVFPVNPHAESVASIECYKNIADIRGAVDLAVLIVPAALVPAAALACGKKGVKGLVVISAGFREVGESGARLEAQLLKQARDYDMRVIGPNCMGIVNTAPAISMNATFASAKPVRGRAAFVSQSGALGEAILSDARSLGIGISQFASIGNRCDVSPNDLMEYWGNDAETDLILMYLESFGNPRNFIRIARGVTRRKPVIAVKGGRSERGSRAASSHTGSLAGRDTAVDAALEQCGVLRVSTMRELFTLAAAFSNQPLPKGNRVLIAGNAGGPNILATDACAGAGLMFAELSELTKTELKKALPPEASCENPVDLIASADAARYEAALNILFNDPGFDASIVLFVSPIHIDAYAVAQAIVRCVPRAGGRPVLVVSLGKLRDEEALMYLRENGLPVYRFPEEAAQALAGMVKYAKLRGRDPGTVPELNIQKDAAAKVVQRARREKREWLRPEECEAILKCYKIPVAETRSVETAESAIAAANALGYPVVLKAASDLIIHKTEVGGVKLDLRNGDDVARAFSELWKLKSGAADLRVLVQSHVKGGRETILGAFRDSQFGPIILFGLGGVFAEALADTQIRVAPLTDVDAREMIRGIRGFGVLAGHRGSDAVDLATLERTVLALSQLMADHDHLLELDLNPFLAFGDGAKSRAIDARIRIEIS